MAQFSEQKLAEVQQIIQRYPDGKQKSALLPVLHLAQQEFGGWLSVETMDYVASLLQLEPFKGPDELRQVIRAAKPITKWSPPWFHFSSRYAAVTKRNQTRS